MYYPALLSILLTGLLPASIALGPDPGSIKNLTTFGDSYTDLSGIGDNGTAWPVYLAGYGNFTLHSKAPFVVQDELPAYFNLTQNGGVSLNPNETIYTLWIGTNDVGTNALITGDQTPGVSIVQVTQCAVNWVKTLYDSGARNFLFQNMIPLNQTILYQWSIFMAELVAAGNELARLMLQNLAGSLPGAHIGLFDSYTLFRDMYDHPENYLNGTAPLNVTGEQIETASYDELHPSEQADRHLPARLVDVINRKNDNFTTWFS
ncbi:hypothetical protein K474DRAFT_1708959 [Panus rudis PR-1116 ss-1]|nr:hypothetical protein K474DRAFT_1708959 [Panus rudis PR-1116 ss-1]